MKFSALKPLLFFLLLLIFFGILTKSVHAQTNYSQPASSSPSTVQTNQNPYAAPNTESNVPNNLHTYSQNVLIEVMSAVSCQIAGVDPGNPAGKCLGPNPKTGKIGYVDNGGGAIGFMGNMISMLYTPPAHTRDYIQNLAQNFGITKHAYADPKPPKHTDYLDKGVRPKTNTPSTDTFGTGFQSISPLMDIWSAFRNISYMIFVLIFVVIGVAIMLRVKIDPRTVMTIQNQIPKIIIGILLVTFSFAIAGFLIDVMWVAIYLFYGVFHSIPGVDVSSLAPQNIAGTTPLGVVGLSGGIDIAYNGAHAIDGIITGFFNNAFGGVFGKILGAIGMVGAAASPAGLVGGLVGGALGGFGGPVGIVAGAAVGATAGGILGNFIGIGGGSGIGNPIAFLGGIVAFLIIAVALLWALVRVWFALIMAYISILINIVFAPFWIIGGLIPGSKVSFSGWLRNMLGNLAAFPATLVMFMLGKTFMDTFSTSYGQFVPPFIGNLAETKTFGSLIGLGIILTIPNVVKMMKSTFGAPELNLGSVGAAVGAGPRLLGGALGTVQQGLSMKYQWTMGFGGGGGGKGGGGPKPKGPEVPPPRKSSFPGN